MNELSVGYRHSTEAGSALTQDGLDAVTRSQIGYTLGPVQRRRSTRSASSRARRSPAAISNPAAITFEGRFPLTGADTFVHRQRHRVARTRQSHASRRASTSSTPATRKGRPGCSTATSSSTSTRRTRSTRGIPTRTRCIGAFRSYTESSARPGGDGTASVLEWFAQDTWKADAQADARLRRALRVVHRTGGRRTVTPRPSRSSGSIRAKAPQLYQPVLVRAACVSRATP